MSDINGDRIKWKPDDEDRFFGYWLPFIGWRTIAYDENDEPVDPKRDGFKPNADYIGKSTLCIAWFDWCLLVLRRG